MQICRLHFQSQLRLLDFFTLWKPEARHFSYRVKFYKTDLFSLWRGHVGLYPCETCCHETYVRGEKILPDSVQKLPYKDEGWRDTSFSDMSPTVPLSSSPPPLRRYRSLSRSSPSRSYSSYARERRTDGGQSGRADYMWPICGVASRHPISKARE